ncbi:MAG: ABC transporter permease, partial [Candidatus Heimdallarchaeota archaeon]|nr:ABC transporter permease [Candidatus Heimdallarchaeota archaeon]
MKLFEIPIFVPKRRYISTIIALIISSAILVSTLSIIIGMNEVSQDLFGTSEDVFVYFNQDTATPFTSRIPMSLMYSFENQNGVKIVSPEIFQPVVIGDESLFIRGVNYSRIFNLENGRLIEGRIPDQSEIYNVMIGKNLKDRMNYQLLQEISFDSLVAEEVVRVKIVGVYETDGITSDEIFTSYPLAMSISGFQANLVTHFRIKYDPSISDENTIINGATQTFAVTFNFETGNSSTQINSMQIKIKDKLENLVKQELFSNSFQLGLLYGEYKLEIINGTNLIYSDSFMVENNFDYNATLFLNVYNVSLQVVYHGNPVHDIEYEIMDDRNTTIISGFSDSIGKLNHNLIEGNYTINFKEGITEQSFDLNVTSTIIDTIELQSLSMINLENIINGSIIPRNIFRLNLENFDSSYLIKLDGSNLNIFSESSFSLPYVSLNLTTGDHNIVVYRSSDSPIILYNIYFSVEPDYELLKTVDLMEGGHYSPNSLHVFDKTSINRFTVIGAIIQSNSPTNTNFTIQLPNNIGFHRIEIVAYDLTNFIIRMTFHIIIENNPLGGGWIAPISHIEVKAGDLVPIWWARNSTNYNINNGTLLKIDEKWYYQVPNGLLDMKNYTSTVTYDGFSFLLNYLYVTAYSNLFRLKNSTSSYLISDIISSEFSIISISNYTFLEVDNLWDLSIKANGRIFQIYDNQILPVFGNNINIVYNLTISSRVIQSSESILFQVRDSLNEIDKPIITMGHNPFIKDGRITFQDIYGSTLNFELNRSGMPYTPIRLFGNTFQLAPGNYSISYYLTTDNKSYRWNLTVPIWHKSLSIKSNYVGNTLGFIISNETVKLPQNEVITSNNRLYLPIANDLVTIDY